MKFNNKFYDLRMKVQNLVNKDFFVYKDLLSEEQIPVENYLNRGLLPSLLIIPVAVLDKVSEKAISLGAMIELSYLAQYVHNHAPEKGEGCDYRMPILIGDFMFASAIKGLVEVGETRWLERMGGVICRMNEGLAVRSTWKERSYVPVDEKVDNLQKECAELSALAGIIGSDLAGFDQETTQIYTAFSYYAGIIQGILLNDYHEEQPSILDLYINYCEQYILSMPEALAKGASVIMHNLNEKLSKRILNPVEMQLA